jgi:hypothetical protein
MCLTRRPSLSPAKLAIISFTVKHLGVRFYVKVEPAKRQVIT